MVDPFPDPSRQHDFVKVSFVALLVGDKEQLLVLVLVLGLSQENLEGSDWIKRAILQHVRP